MLGTLLSILFLGLNLTAAFAAPEERHRLYTAPDVTAGGGIEGRIVYPEQPILQILAIPSDAPELVYQGTLSGPDQHAFRFEGLPMRSYDLVAIYEGSFYEGLRLHRGESTLTEADRTKIETAIQASEPFFTRKIVHRLEGDTGRGSFARGVCTFLRDQSSGFALAKQDGQWVREDYRRTFKVVILKDVGPGWQIVRSRDLYPVWAKPTQALPQHAFRSQLSRIRVTDRVKDVGDIDLRR